MMIITGLFNCSS